jgi:hypothetical protein
MFRRKGINYEGNIKKSHAFPMVREHMTIYKIELKEISMIYKKATNFVKLKINGTN